VATSPDEQDLRAAIAAAPDNVIARQRLAELLLGQGRTAEALSESMAALGRFPDDGSLLGLTVMAAELSGDAALAARYARLLDAVSGGVRSSMDLAGVSGGVIRWGRRRTDRIGDRELIDLTGPPVFDPREHHPSVERERSERAPDQEQGKERSRWPLARRVKPNRQHGPGRPVAVTSPTVTLADVSGMTDLKWRLQGVIAANGPESTMTGGLLLFGPRGCAKGYFAEAVAGQLGARMVRINLNDVVELGDPDGTELLRMAFTLARQTGPCVLVLEDLDALSDPSRLHARRVDIFAMRLAMKLDECRGAKGLTIIATSSAPWRIDASLRAVGRFERGLFVPPPDLLSRARILADRLSFMPLGSDVNAGDLAGDTEGMSAAELLGVCAAAAEHALCVGRHAGTMWPVTQRDLRRAADAVDPAAREWFTVAHAQLRNGSGEVDTVFDYIRRHIRRF
jgi:transitional endoplasmic reticulum ATPase